MGGLEVAAGSHGWLRISNPDWCESVAVLFPSFSSFLRSSEVKTNQNRTLWIDSTCCNQSDYLTAAAATRDRRPADVRASGAVGKCQRSAACGLLWFVVKLQLLWLSTELQLHSDATLRNHKRNRWNNHKLWVANTERTVMGRAACTLTNTCHYCITLILDYFDTEENFRTGWLWSLFCDF